MAKRNIIEEALSSSTNRRGLLKKLAVASAAVGASTLPVSAQTPSPADVIQFALNLEYLEAEFYLKATYNASLISFGVINSSQETGPTTGGKMVNFKGANFAFVASEIRRDEVEHVKFLRAALGSAAVPKPAINLDALGYGYASVNDFLKLARQFEDVGISAYLGAATLIQSKTYLDAAARILATEAQHSGSIRPFCVMYGVNSPAVDGKDVPPTAQTPFDVDKNGLSIPRTAQEVLKIVYGGGTTSGGFYPSGMNGTIK